GDLVALDRAKRSCLARTGPSSVVAVTNRETARDAGPARSSVRVRKTAVLLEQGIEASVLSFDGSNDLAPFAPHDLSIGPANDSRTLPIAFLVHASVRAEHHESRPELKRDEWVLAANGREALRPALRQGEIVASRVIDDRWRRSRFAEQGRVQAHAIT